MTYLGVTFSSSGKFATQSNNAIKKTQIAINKTISILSKAKSDSWETKSVLFDTLIKSVLTYASEIWTANYLDNVECTQTKFVKVLFHLPINTPNYIIRYEIEKPHLKIYIIISMLEW